jgi:hypothetical protein
MLLTKEVEVKLKGKNIKYYENLGYEIPRVLGYNNKLVVKNGTTIIVSINDLQPTSEVKVYVMCDLCQEHISYIRYHDYNRRKHGDIYCCNACSKIYQQKTCMERYGVKSPLQIPKTREMLTRVCLERYGVENPSQALEIQEKQKRTFLERYNVGNPFQSPEVKEKMRQTWIARYGVDRPTKSPKILEKQRNTCLAHYGVEYPSQAPFVQEKIRKSMQENGTVPTSSQQVAIYELLKKYYGEDRVEINCACGKCSIDISIFFENISIDVEYDGWYWHQNARRDRARDEFIKTQGYKILRIKSRTMIPDFTDLVNKIETLRDGEHTYNEIVLPDWKTVQNDCNNNQTNTDDESLGIN